MKKQPRPKLLEALLVKTFAPAGSKDHQSAVDYIKKSEAKFLKHEEIGRAHV